MRGEQGARELGAQRSTGSCCVAYRPSGAAQQDDV